MKVKVKHKETEVEVSDELGKQDTYGLIYYNQNYLLNLLEKIADQIVKMNKDEQVPLTDNRNI
jgi:hypothetical protein